MGDAIRILAAYQWGHGDDILRIVVLDGTEIAELTLPCGSIGNDVGSLNIKALPLRLRTHKIYLASMKECRCG